MTSIRRCPSWLFPIPFSAGPGNPGATVSHRLPELMNSPLASETRPERALVKLPIGAGFGQPKADLLQAILTSDPGVSLYALDCDYRYTEFSISHQAAIWEKWGRKIALGMNLLEVIGDPADREKAKAQFDRVFQGEPLLLVEESGASTYPRRFQENRYHPIFDSTGGRIVGAVVLGVDIRDRKPPEVEQRLQGRALRAVANAIVITDQSGKVVWVNPAFTRLTGYESHEVLGQNPRMLKSDHHPPAFYRQIWETIRAGKIWSGEIVNKRKDGSVYTEEMAITPVTNEPGEITHFIAVKHDISERKQAEEAARASQQLIEGIMNTMPVRVFWKDKNLIFLGCNTAFARDAGFAGPEEVIGKNSFQTAGRDRAEMYHKDDRQVIESGCAKLFIEEQQTTREGKTRTLLTSKLPLRNSQGEISGVLGTYMDITDRKQAEKQLHDRNRQLGDALAELNRTQQQVIQQEQLRGLGQMASGVAHDFNNALAPIIGFSEFLLQHPEKLADQAQVLKWLTSIHTCATDAAAVVRRMREFGRQDAGRDEQLPIDLNRVVLQTLELTEPRWKDQAQAMGRTIHIATDLQPVPLITGEEFAMREVLTNLIFNAVDALNQGGTLTLGTALRGGDLILWVSDTGVGMSEETRQRCLEPFFTTKGQQGTGLGLSLVHGIVQRHGGTLEIASQPGRGTTVTLRLPIPRSAPQSENPPAESTQTKSLRVLVVDDEPLVCEVVTEWLTTDGHTVATAQNGAAALQQFRADQFDLVLTDKAMPDMSGEQLAVALHESGAAVPVILMTGFGDLMKAAGEKPPHVRAILSKPMTGASFRAVLAEVFPLLVAAPRSAGVGGPN